MASNIIEEASAKVAAQLIAAIEAGEATGEWQKPWQAITMRQRNPLSGSTYHGINPIILSFMQIERGYERPLWVTFNQVRDAGGRLKDAKGQGIRLVHFRRFLSCDTHGKGKWKSVKSECCGNMRSRPGASTFVVFNVALVEGIEFPDDAKIVRTEHERIEAAEAFVAALGVDVRYVDQDRAFYTPSRDAITMPSADLFHDQRGLYGTLFHEIVHWSGHESRTNRANKNPFGSALYAAEELVAELGSAVLMRMFDLEPEPHMEHALYLKSWAKVLKDDPNVLYEAAKTANQAVQWLTEAAKAQGVSLAA